MVRKLLLAVAVAVAAFAVPVAFADDDDKKADDKTAKKGKLAGKVDKAKMFEQMDANKDGKLSKDEFKAGLEKMAEKLKEKAGDKGGGKAAGMLDKIADKVFEKLDADKDGSISKEEFEKGEFDPSNLKDLRAKFGKGK
jgi:hypothetical protein